MKIVYNKYIPFGSFAAINLFGVVFAKDRYKPLSGRSKSHEGIHTSQMAELLYIFFYLWYGIEWGIRFIQYKDSMKAYRNISFEREAYTNDRDIDYLKQRKHYSFLRYLRLVKQPS